LVSAKSNDSNTLSNASIVGIHVTTTDKMPQNCCFICLDKINDFYEFRSMSLSTDKQTRETLGLPLETEKKKKPIILNASPVVRLVDLKHSAEDKVLIERALQRLKRRKSSEDDIPTTSYQSVKTELPVKKSRRDIVCSICTDASFSYLSDLQDHQMKHVPLISKYACGSCQLTFEQLADFKEHETMHTKKKLPYFCFICASKFTKLKDFTK
jgi:hypothetical protein